MSCTIVGISLNQESGYWITVEGVRYYIDYRRPTIIEKKLRRDIKRKKVIDSDYLTKLWEFDIWISDRMLKLKQ